MPNNNARQNQRPPPQSTPTNKILLFVRLCTILGLLCIGFLIVANVIILMRTAPAVAKIEDAMGVISRACNIIIGLVMSSSLLSIQCIGYYFHFLKSWISLGICMTYLGIVSFTGIPSANQTEETIKYAACYSLMGVGCLFAVCGLCGVKSSVTHRQGDGQHETGVPL